MIGRQYKVYAEHGPILHHLIPTECLTCAINQKKRLKKYLNKTKTNQLKIQAIFYCISKIKIAFQAIIQFTVGPREKINTTKLQMTVLKIFLKIFWTRTNLFTARESKVKETDRNKKIWRDTAISTSVFDHSDHMPNGNFEWSSLLERILQLKYYSILFPTQ